ncbi:MAG: hypothetical protein HGA38_02685 [Candidatus Moranbacteria bacterium]|nr:hypothetical protein [Candidatus Moranbacteria bacterium]
MPILMSKAGGSAQRVERSEFDKEDSIQEYIHRNPDAIPVYEIREDKRLFVAKREFGTASGPIDALAFDKDGDIYVVETKLFRNPDKRTVVAQALDYGAALWKEADFDGLVRTLDEECARKFSVDFFGKFGEFFELDEEGIGSAMEAIRHNLDDGNIKFVILMDSMNDRLRDLILYVNQNSQFDIYAVTMEYYRHEEYEIMIPKIFGVEVKKSVGVSAVRQSRQWDEASFMEQARKSMGDDLAKLVEVYRLSNDVADSIKWGSGKYTASFAPIFKKISGTSSPFSVFTDGSVLIKFAWLRNHVEPESLKKYEDLFAETVKTGGLHVPDFFREKEYTIPASDFSEHYKTIMAAIRAVAGKR